MNDRTHEKEVKGLNQETIASELLDLFLFFLQGGFIGNKKITFSVSLRIPLRSCWYLRH